MYVPLTVTVPEKPLVLAAPPCSTFEEKPKTPPAELVPLAVTETLEEEPNVPEWISNLLPEEPLLTHSQIALSNAGLSLPKSCNFSVMSLATNRASNSVPLYRVI